MPDGFPLNANLCALVLFSLGLAGVIPLPASLPSSWAYVCLMSLCSSVP